MLTEMRRAPPSARARATRLTTTVHTSMYTEFPLNAKRHLPICASDRRERGDELIADKIRSAESDEATNGYQTLQVQTIAMPKNI